MHAITYTNQEWHRTVKTLVVKKLWRIIAFCQVFLPIFTISIIPYANVLQFAKVFYCTVHNLLSQINNHYFHVHNH